MRSQRLGSERRGAGALHRARRSRRRQPGGEQRRQADHGQADQGPLARRSSDLSADTVRSLQGKAGPAGRGPAGSAGPARRARPAGSSRPARTVQRRRDPAGGRQQGARRRRPGSQVDADLLDGKSSDFFAPFASTLLDGDAAGGDLGGSFPSPQILSGSVGAPEIAPDAVGAEEIAPDSVSGAEIVNSSIDAPDLAPGPWRRARSPWSRRAQQTAQRRRELAADVQLPRDRRRHLRRHTVQRQSGRLIGDRHPAGRRHAADRPLPRPDDRAADRHRLASALQRQRQPGQRVELQLQHRLHRRLSRR